MITAQQVAHVTDDQFTAEASTLGWRPGVWPAQVDCELGNKQPLIRKRREMYDGELQYVEYWQAFGTLRLTVWND